MHDSATSGAGTVILPERMSSPPLLRVWFVLLDL